MMIMFLLFSQGANLVSGGLDALETLGRKTVDVLTEGDPGQYSCSSRLARIYWGFYGPGYRYCARYL